jgi:flagellar biosynthesis protein FlhG
MNDQAENLRQMVQSLQQQIREEVLQSSPRPCRIVAVTSGKGGVGKTNLALALAITLSKAGYRVMFLDGDLGMANADVVLGIFARYDLSHVIAGSKELQEVIVEGPAGLKLVPGGSGIDDLANIDPAALTDLLSQAAMLDNEVDYLFIDTGAGISNQVLALLQAAGEVLLISTPEPTAMADAYGLVKVFHQRRGEGQLKLIVNMTRSREDGRLAADRLQQAAHLFLHLDLECLGEIPSDRAVPEAVKRHQSFVTAYPASHASAATIRIASQLGRLSAPSQGVRAFFSKFVSVFSARDGQRH